MGAGASVTPEQYLEALPEDRRALIGAVRELILRNVPAGYTEAVAFDMLTWSIPLARYPDTYNGQPLACIALASKKNYCTLHLNSVYQSPEREQRLRAAYADAGRKLDLGKACIRFRRLEDLHTDAIAELIADVTPDCFIAEHEAARTR
ncbi:MAG TPA: DUF1801 domain-containing protein [Longimicrobiales bacterium]|nr:DUF1801 domain-containing protein [Longimicrobiales bacterium]